MRGKYIIDFNGMPGCGKTTIAEKVVEFLSDRFSVATLRDVYFYKEKGIAHQIIFFTSAILSIKNFAFNMQVLKLISCYKYSRTRLFDALRLIKLNYQLSKFYKYEEVDIILLEEGLVQYLSSIPT